MAKRALSTEAIKKKAIGLIDQRATDNDGMLVKRDRNVTMLDIFGDEQKTAVAYYVSDLLAKGFNNQQIIETVKRKYNLEWSMVHVNKVKALLHKMWRCEMAHSMNDQIAREVATIDTQIKETWEAFEFSKKGIKHTRTRTEGSKSQSREMTYDLTEVITDEDTMPGDVKYLQHLNELGKEKRKLLGLYAPEKKAPGTGTNNGTINFVVVGSDGSSLSAPLMTQQPAQPVEEVQADVVEPEEVDMENLFNEMMA